MLPPTLVTMRGSITSRAGLQLYRHTDMFVPNASESSSGSRGAGRFVSSLTRASPVPGGWEESA